MRIKLLPIALGALVLGYQNCSGQLEVKPRVSDAEFFSLDQKSAPAFFASVGLYQEAGESTRLRSFKFFGSAVHATDHALPVGYKVRISSEKGETLCPTHSGTLTGGQTSIEFDCVSPVSSTRALVELTLDAGTDTEVVAKAF